MTAGQLETISRCIRSAAAKDSQSKRMIPGNPAALT